MNKQKLIDAVAVEVTKKFTDAGLLVEAGWAAYAIVAMPKNADAAAIGECRMAFMAGAEHLFDSIMNFLDPGEEPTMADLRRMDLVQQEIDIWRAKLFERVHPTQGRG